MRKDWLFAGFIVMILGIIMYFPCYPPIDISWVFYILGSALIIAGVLMKEKQKKIS